MIQGILYGIGVGPGDPDLLTFKAAKTLDRVDVVFAASSSANDYSQALDIARPHMKPDARIIRLGFPMTREPSRLHAAWEENADQVLAVLREGKNAAFLTLGDPLTFSTFSYLLSAVTAKDPELRVEIVPGVTSYQAAAAEARIPLAESGQRLGVLPGVAGKEELRETLKCLDTAVILKAYRKLPDIKEVLEEEGLYKRSVFVTRVGLEGQAVFRNLDEVPENPHYFSPDPGGKGRLIRPLPPAPHLWYILRLRHIRPGKDQ